MRIFSIRFLEQVFILLKSSKDFANDLEYWVLKSEGRTLHQYSFAKLREANLFGRKINSGCQKKLMQPNTARGVYEKYLHFLFFLEPNLQQNHIYNHRSNHNTWASRLLQILQTNRISGPSEMCFKPFRIQDNSNLLRTEASSWRVGMKCFQATVRIPEVFWQTRYQD